MEGSSGRVNMGKMLKETWNLWRFPMTPQQQARRERQVFTPHRVLESDVGGRDEDRLRLQTAGGPEMAVHRPGRQIGAGLADDCTAVLRVEPVHDDLPDGGEAKIPADRVPFNI